MKQYKKQDFPVWKIRRYLEPGPVVLVSSAWQDKQNIMTMAWQTVMEFSPALVGCVISAANDSFEMVRRGRSCVINLPTAALIDTVVGIGNCSGAEIDKFEHFGLTPEPSLKVKPPGIAECFASFECRLSDDSWIDKYNFFVWEVVCARVASSPRQPRTLHYQGAGEFMRSGDTVSRRRLFRPEMLLPEG